MTLINDYLDILADLDLKSGGHASFEAGVCAMEAVAWLAGEPHSDHPNCASPVLGAFMRSWNDALGDDDRQVLKPYLPRLVGTRKDDALEERLSWMAADWLVREQAPAWLRLAGMDEQADLLASMTEVTPDTAPSIKSSLGAVRQQAFERRAAAWDAAGAAAWDAAGAAAWDAAGAAAWAAGAAAWDAAGAAAWAAGAAAGAAARDAAGAAARAAAGAAAWDALRPTTETLQLSALGLLDRMVTTAEQWEPAAA